MNGSKDNFIVNTYIIHRLEELGIENVFGVPGDYVLDFLDYLCKSNLKWVGTCNELNAGYCADGYARVKGIGAAVVTYGVGGFSILNAVSGAYAEQVPMIVISGAPHSARRRANALVHHLTNDYFLQYDIFRKVTVDAVMLSNPLTAPEEIDRVLRNCIMQKRPVYIELPLDVGKMQCKSPAPFIMPEPPKSDYEALLECVEEASERINNAKNPVILVGVEILRFGLQKETMDLVEKIELPFATTISSKAALPELHPQFMGIYQGSMSRPEVKNQIETSDCVISLGVWLTDFDTGGFTAYIDEKNLINANSEQVKIRRHSYSNIQLGDFIKLLAERIKPRSYLLSHPHARFTPSGEFNVNKEGKITAKRFYDRLNRFLEDDMVLLAEPGDAICAVPELQIEEADNFISQAYYLSIGFCTPASLGVTLANPSKRAIVLSGDGAFQMTANEISTHMKNNSNAVFFIINNDGYLIERLLHEDGPYNDIQQWKYAQLPKVFGDNAICLDVWTEGDLENSLDIIKKEKDKLIFIELHFEKYDCSIALHRLGENFRKLAEGKS